MREVTNGLVNIGKAPEDKRFELSLTFEEIKVLNMVALSVHKHPTVSYTDELDNFCRDTHEVCEAILARNPAR